MKEIELSNSEENAVEMREVFATKRLVVKIGTSTITDDQGNLDIDFIDNVVDQVHVLQEAGVKVAIVSSGAVACGKALLKNYDSGTILSNQVYSTRGQTMLMNAFSKSFDRYGIHTFQYLLTQSNFEHPELPLSESMEIGVPIINFNDAVSDQEMIQVKKDKDNDDIASQVASIVKADTAVFLTRGNGVKDRDGKVLAILAEESENLIFSGVSKGGTGGMEKKVGFAREVAQKGINVFIAEGRTEDILLRIAKGEHVGTRVVAGDSIR